MDLALIAAVARDGGIGRADGLLFRLPDDLRHFKQLTLGCPVVMGRRTWDSLPAAFRPLPGRRNVVVTRQAALHAPLAAAGAEPAASLDEALARLQDAARVFVIGGGELYALALPDADVLELTEVEADAPDADTHFPAWRREDFDETTRQTRETADGLRYHWTQYRRRRPAADTTPPAT